MPILQKIQNFLFHQCRLHPKEKVLVAVSGGLDSVSLCEILYQLDVPFGIAHCNFKLRGKDSDHDASFVAQMAQNYKVSFFETEFSMETLAKQSTDSIQMLARRLRYDWLETVRKQQCFQAVATAHHQNDTVETVLYNLSKGTGIAGLHGIPARNQYTIRPLLCVTREELAQFAKEHQLKHREDASNATTKYARNKIRHLVIPALKEINPKLEQTFFDNCQRFKEAEELYRFAIAQQSKKLIEKRREDFFIPILKLQKHTIAPKTVLWEILKKWQFTTSQVQDIVDCIDSGASGKLFYSPTHRLLKDRRFLIISVLANEHPSLFLLNADERKVALPECTLNIKTVKREKYVLENNPKIAALDFDQLAFPLKLRKWKAGDYFYPMGLFKASGKVGKQKLKKYFGNQKFSVHQKEKVWILQDNEDRIVWIVGERMDERFKITDKTQRIYRIRIKHAKPK